MGRLRTPARHPILLWLLLAGACVPDPTDVACTEEEKPGIIVEVRDGGGARAVAEGSTLTLRDGDYVEVVDKAMDSLRLAGAWDRPGVYDVRVGREGWVPWRVIDINVEMDACHVTPVVLEAFLIEIDRR